MTARLFTVQGWRVKAQSWPVDEMLLGLWLNGFLVAMLVGRGGRPELLFVALAGGAMLVAWRSIGRPARAEPGLLSSWGALLMLFAVLASYFANLDRYPPQFVLGNVVSMLIALGMARSLATRFELDYRVLLASHALSALPLMAVLLFSGKMVWGRFSGGDLHPNFIGMVAMTTFIGALGLRGLWLRTLALGCSAALMIAASSRASILASAVATISWALCVLGMPCPVAQHAARTRRIALVLLGVVLVLAALQVGGVEWLQGAGDALLKVNDPYRGIQSGASGRTELWAAALALWQAHPVLGVGFKGHAALMPDGMLAHSAYLGMLADTGVVGLAGYLLLCATAVSGLWRMRQQPTLHTALALVVSFLVYGIVESRGFGFGNSYSMLFLWIAFMADRRQHCVGAAGLARGTLPKDAG